MSAIALVLLLGAAPVASQGVYVDVGSCIGGPCSRDGWFVATGPLTLRAAPHASAGIVGAVSQGDVVDVLTGQIHALPRRLTVRRASGEFAVGDDVTVYTYRGAGWYHIRHNGILKDADLGISPWSTDPRCVNGSHCWGTLDAELSLVEWVKVRTGRESVEGWVQGTAAFRQTDAREGVPDPDSPRRRAPRLGPTPRPNAARVLRLLRDRLRQIEEAVLARAARAFPPDVDLAPLIGVTRDRLHESLGPHFMDCELPLEPTTGEPVYDGPCRSNHDVQYAFDAGRWLGTGVGTLLVVGFDHRDVAVRATWWRRP